MKSIAPYSRIKEDAIVKDIIFSMNTKKVRNLIKSGDLIVCGNLTKSIIGVDECDSTVLFYDDDSISIKHDYIEVGSFVLLSYLDSVCSKHNISNFNLVGTIPGRIGGSLINNAEFLNESIYDFLISVDGFDHQGEKKKIKREEIETHYRYSNLASLLKIVTKARFKISKETEEKIRERHRQAYEKRKQQPNVINTLGSTFKNLEHIKAYKLVEEVKPNFKSSAFNISSVHSNYLNFNPYTKGSDLKSELMRLQEEVCHKTNEKLELEIRFLAH